jgi:hypothetical protein
MEASLKSLREVGKSELLEILDTLRGRKSLVLEKSLKKLLFEIVFNGDQGMIKDVSQYDINTRNLSEALEAQVPHILMYVYTCI